MHVLIHVHVRADIHPCALSHTHAVPLLHHSSRSLSLLSSAASSACGLDIY